jgi:DNA-binding response OmpR family regulator
MSSRFHILIVEDDPLVADVLQTTLETEYCVSCAKTIGEARAFLQSAHLDAMLIDYFLPDGRSDEIIELAETVGTAVVEMSGYPVAMAGLEQRGHPRLQKPFGAATLLSTMDSVLRLAANRG